MHAARFDADTDVDRRPLIAKVAPDGGETRKLTTGEALDAPPVAPEEREALEAQLAAARAASEAAPGDADALIRYGRCLGALGRFRDAATVFTDGIERFPDDPRVWRFRGHRWITLRQFVPAVADLERAELLAAGTEDVVEPSLKPNARGVDLDTLQENIEYHLALAHYLLGDWDAAAEHWRVCRALARNDDGLCMASYWLAMALVRGGHSQAEVRAELEPISAAMDVVEYHSYQQLALVWKGELDALQLLESTSPDGDSAIDFATIGYGVGCWRWCLGDRAGAWEIWRRVEAGPAWHAFGHIAAETELARQSRG